MNPTREDDVQGIKNNALFCLFGPGDSIPPLKGCAVFISFRPYADPVMFRIIKQGRPENDPCIIEVESLNRIDGSDLVDLK